jgi:hypothetical protein
MYMLCTDVGQVHPTYFSRTRRCPLPKAGPTIVIELVATVGGPPAGEAERLLRWMEWNLTH